MIPGNVIHGDGSFDLIISERNIWEVYESFSDEAKITATHRWVHCYKNVDTDFAKSVIAKCQELLVTEK